MPIVTISPKYQIVIPSSIRKSLDLRVGQKVQIFLYENRIEMVPIKDMSEIRGFLKGIDTTIEREPDRL